MLYHTEIYYTTRYGKAATSMGTHNANSAGEAEQMALDYATMHVKANRVGNVRVLPYSTYWGIDPRR